MTQGLADAFADAIAAHPQDWHMLQRLWTEDLDRGAAAGAGDVRPGDPHHEPEELPSAGRPRAV
jgi:hypothetical protein